MVVTHTNLRSKRAHLRFSGNRKVVNFKTEFEDGEAQLANISAGGAALEESTLTLEVSTKILLSIDFLWPENPLEIQALVVRSEQSSFSVKFLLLEDGPKKDILKFFARQKREDTQHPESRVDE